MFILKIVILMKYIANGATARPGAEIHFDFNKH